MAPMGPRSPDPGLVDRRLERLGVGIARVGRPGHEVDARALRLERFVVEREGHVPFRTVLAGDGPWTIAVPDGELELAVAAANGERLDAVVVFGDNEVGAKGGAVQLRGLPHGPLRAFVSAPGHRSAIVDVVVGPEPRTLRIELPLR